MSTTWKPSVSPQSELAHRLEEAVQLLKGSQILPSGRRVLANGVRMEFSCGGSSCSINFYHSRKKGFSVIPAGGDADLALRIKGILSADAPGLPAGIWTGSDEAGKGDYMGPLTVAAVTVDRERAESFRQAGITDSKLLSNDAVRSHAGMIRDSSPGCFSVVTLSPAEYNARFDELSGIGKNSLDILAECHAEALRSLIDSPFPPGLVIIDRFCNEKRISHLLPDGDYRLDLRFRAESDPAVAAASILARDAYLSELDLISAKYGIRAVSGSGAPTDKVVKEFVRAFGADILDEIVKVHFKNTMKVLSLFD